MNSYDSKKALLSNLIDYAGTFPPAALPFEKALAEALVARKSYRHPWLFSKVALTMELLKKVNARVLFQMGGEGNPLPLAALGTAIPETGTEEDFARIIEWDLREIKRFNERGFQASYRHWVVSYDTKIPNSLFGVNETSQVEDFVWAALDRIHAQAAMPLAVFLEVPISKQLDDALKMVRDAIHDWFEENTQTHLQVGLKIRTTGTHQVTSAEFAKFISFCVGNGFRFKATQGLHHAISKPGEFGFVNVFAALTLAQAMGTETFGEALVQECLDCPDAKKFKFGADKFSWAVFELDLDTIEAARRQHGGCFGSCSMQEPDDFLTRELKD